MGKGKPVCHFRHIITHRKTLSLWQETAEGGTARQDGWGQGGISPGGLTNCNGLSPQYLIPLGVRTTWRGVQNLEPLIARIVHSKMSPKNPKRYFQHLVRWFCTDFP